MAVKIDRTLCNGCGKAKEPRCVAVCPGDLLYRDADNLCRIRDSRDCWDCASCIKECPRQAIAMYLPEQIGGRGSTLRAKSQEQGITWFLTGPDGTEKTIEIQTKYKTRER